MPAPRRSGGMRRRIISAEGRTVLAEDPREDHLDALARQFFQNVGGQEERADVRGCGSRAAEALAVESFEAGSPRMSGPGGVTRNVPWAPFRAVSPDKGLSDREFT